MNLWFLVSTVYLYWGSKLEIFLEVIKHYNIPQLDRPGCSVWQLLPALLQQDITSRTRRTGFGLTHRSWVPNMVTGAQWPRPPASPPLLLPFISTAPAKLCPRRIIVGNNWAANKWTLGTLMLGPAAFHCLDISAVTLTASVCLHHSPAGLSSAPRLCNWSLKAKELRLRGLENGWFHAVTFKSHSKYLKAAEHLPKQK